MIAITPPFTGSFIYLTPWTYENVVDIPLSEGVAPQKTHIPMDAR